MGSFDCYCILCAVAMNIGSIRLGSRQGKSLSKRARFVDREKRRLAGEKVERGDIKSEDEDEEMEDAIDDEAVEKQRIEQQEQDEDDADSDYEHSSETSSEGTESVDSNDSDLLTGSPEILDAAVRPRTPEPEPEPEEEVDQDNWSQASELDFNYVWGAAKYADVEFDEEDGGFDPRLVGLEDFRWINRVRALALNPEGKAYISGRGRYYDYGALDVLGTGRDPNDPGETSLDLTTYNEDENNQAFPFHEACFDILAKRIGLEKGKDVDKDVMWKTLSTLLVDEMPVLEVDYNLRLGHQQWWCNVPGAEYEVCDPSPRPALQDSLQDILPPNLFSGAQGLADLTHKVRSDPVAVLPYDILLEIIGYLDSKDVFSFLKASYHANSATRGAAFWKHLLRLRVLPWFYELRYFVETASIDALDYKGLFLWVDALTCPKFGNHGPLMHIANRRRIWGCCQPVASLYKKTMASVEPAEPADSEEAKAILSSSMCLHTPMTMYPPPDEAEAVSVQFIHSWNEVGHRSCVLDTFWRHDERTSDYLVGISVTLGGQKRLLGSSEGISGHPLHLESGEWVEQIICRLGHVDMFKENMDGPDRRPGDVKPFRTTFISGMQVFLTTGKKKTMRQHYGNTMDRPFCVLDGMYLVGLKGEIASNGAISRLGLLQASKPDSAPIVQPQQPPAQRIPWDPKVAWLPIYEGNGRERAPIWSHPSIHYDPFPASTHPSPYDPHEDVIPSEVFMWGKGNAAIECFQPVAMDVVALPHQTLIANPTEEPTSSTYQLNTGLDIVGIQPAPHNQFGGRGEGVGQKGPVICQHPEWTKGSMSYPLDESLRAMWKDLYKQNAHPFGTSEQHNTVTFPLNNESITEVHVEQRYRALKLVTQSGRVGYFGEPNMRDWFVRKAVDRERFVGISTSFGALGGWSESARMWSHFKLSRVGVLFERVDEEGKVISKGEEMNMRNAGVVFEEGRVVTCSE